MSEFATNRANLGVNAQGGGARRCNFKRCSQEVCFDQDKPVKNSLGDLRFISTKNWDGMSRSIKLFHDFICQIFRIATPPPNKTVKTMLIQTGDVWSLNQISIMVIDLIDRIKYNYQEYENQLRYWNANNTEPKPIERGTLILECCADKLGTTTSNNLDFLSGIARLLNKDIDTMKKNL